MMRPVPERRNTPGRRSGDHAASSLQGVLHDVGHGITIIGYVIHSLLDEDALPCSARENLELLSRETGRLSDVIGHATMRHGRAELVRLQPLLTQLVSLLSVLGGPRISLRAADAELHVESMILWRILANLVGNAIDAAWPAGHVEIAVYGERPLVIEIRDDGTGFAAASEPVATLGLRTVAELAKACAAEIEIRPREPVGTRARVIFRTGGRLLTPASDIVANMENTA
ncbi:sensor histidine kinase [Actinophytocola sp.]|uniref:sensor histidine kinase n=1 Tax=Actinophytocola sp. TaxID=1872138 RepID=UPI002ED083D5